MIKLTNVVLNGNSYQKSYLDSVIRQVVIVLTVIELNGPLVTTGERKRGLNIGCVTLRNLKV